jgi:hypothetical protein
VVSHTWETKLQFFNYENEKSKLLSEAFCRTPKTFIVSKENKLHKDSPTLDMK